MKAKKLLTLLVATVMMVSLFAGCGKNGGNAEQSKDQGAKTADAGKKQEVTTLNILYPGDVSDRFSEFLKNEFADRMMKDLSMKVNVTFLPWAQYWEQKDIMLAAKEPIDLYWDGLPDLASFVNKKQARVLNDLIDKYAGDMLKVLPKEQLKGATINGKIYGIPTAYAPSSAMYQLVTVRQDILEAVGMKEIKTAEDLMEFAERTKKQFPNMKGPADIIFKPLTRYFTDEQYHWVAYQDLVVFGEESKKVYSYFETPAFQKLAKFNREMYKKGLYTEDLTIKYNERDSRMQTGLYLWVEGSVGKEMEIDSTVKANAPEARLKSYLLKPDGPRYITATGGEVLCIPETAPNPDGAMRFLNWIYASKDNYMFALYGVEGKDYEIVDGRVKKLSSNDFFYEWMFRNKNYQMFAPEIDQKAIDTYEHWDDNAIRSVSLGFRFNNESVKNIETALAEVAGKDLLPIETGFADFDTEYPKAIAKLKAAGIDKYVQEVQRQFDEFMAQKNK